MKKEIVNNQHEGYLFAGHEVIFQVVHQGTTDGIFDAINGFLNDTQFPDDNWRKRLEQPNADSRIITFPSPPGEPDPDQPRPFSLIPLTILGHDPRDPTPDDVLNLLNEAYTELEGRFFEQGGGDVILLQADEEGEEAKTIDLGGGYELKSISPNWLASNLHHTGNTGGPGSLPAERTEIEEDSHQFRLKGQEPPHVSLLRYKSPAAEEGKVQVAILDTARPLTDFDTFPSRIKDMFIGVEVVPYLDPQELSDFDPYATWPHHYEMRDHGTFIASIVRAIASDAKVYLHEVLNSFGVGSLKSIAQGLTDAAGQDKPLVINCSFLLAQDLEALKEKLKDLNALLLLKPRIQALMRLPLQDVFRTTTLIPDVIVVAAAGNDNDSSPVNRPGPRFPAAYDRVLSVAALPKGNPRHPQSNTPNSRKYKTAAYSNLAHSSGSSKEAYSFATFGGDLVNGSSRPSHGVLGVYIGGIPTQNPDGTLNPGPANTTGWAEWSGTSFAAPIISALLAAKESELECDNPNIPLSDPPDPARPYRTVDDENVILIRQGE